MSRTADASLQDRILDIALALLRLHGENGVTMRAVAEAADTTTPTLYSRFPNKDALLLALALRERDRYVTSQTRRKSLEDAARGYLDWAAGHPHEYRLIYGTNWPKVLSAESGRPGLRWTQEQFAKRFGGKPEQYETLTNSLWLVLHGASDLLSQKSSGEAVKYVRREALAACDRLIRSAPHLRT